MFTIYIYMYLRRLIYGDVGKIVISIILGLGLATLFRKVCKDRDCIIFKAPDIKKIKNQIFKFDGKCYQFEENIEKCNKVIKSNLFRPPYGKIHPLSISEIKNKYKIIMWDVMSYDFKLEKEACYKEIIKKTKKGSIIVFHENSKSFDKLKYVLPKILKYFSKKGYRFNTIPIN